MEEKKKQISALARLRKSRGFDQDELAAAIGVSTSTISSWERGRTEPNLSAIRTLSHVLDYPVLMMLDAAIEAPDQSGAAGGTPWTPALHGALRAAWAAGDNVAEIARDLGRTTAAIAFQLHCLDLGTLTMIDDDGNVRGVVNRNPERPAKVARPVQPKHKGKVLHTQFVRFVDGLASLRPLRKQPDALMSADLVFGSAISTPVQSRVLGGTHSRAHGGTHYRLTVAGLAYHDAIKKDPKKYEALLLNGNGAVTLGGD